MASTNNPLGATPKLTPEVQKVICDSLAIGCYLTEALLLAGIDQRTFRRWMDRGRKERERIIAAEHDLTWDSKHNRPRKETKKTAAMRKKHKEMQAREEMFLRFLVDVESAMARAEHSMLGVITRAALGGAVIETNTITRRRDDGTEETSVIEKKSRPEWTAAAWRLERRYPSKWGRRNIDLNVEGSIDVSPSESAREKLRKSLSRMVDVEELNLVQDENSDESDSE